MAWLIFVAYLVFFSWLITRIGFIKRSGIANRLLVALFLVKVAAGIIYFQFHSLPEYKFRSDTWRFYQESLAEKKVLLADPAAFVNDFFVSGYGTRGNLFSDANSYWNDAKASVMIKLMAIINVVTLDHYYSNIIFFSFIFFIGLIAFYRLLQSHYCGQRLSLIIAIFFIPSFLFWCSGIHKDGLIFSCIAFVLYSFNGLLQQKRVLLHTLIILLSLLLMFFLRNYLVFAMIPCLLAGWLLRRYPKHKLLVMVLLLSIGAGLFFTAKYLHPSLDFPAYIADKQKQFKQLEGNSVVHMNDLEPSFPGFLKNLPAAIDMSFFRPHPGEKGLMSVVASIEIYVFWLVVLVAIVYQRRALDTPPVTWVCFLFALIVLIIIGYTVPFSGAVVRYRALVLPLILAPLIANLRGR